MDEFRTQKILIILLLTLLVVLGIIIVAQIFNLAYFKQAALEESCVQKGGVHAYGEPYSFCIINGEAKFYKFTCEKIRLFTTTCTATPIVFDTNEVQ